MEQGSRVAALPDNHHRFVCGAHLLLAVLTARRDHSPPHSPATLRSTAVLLLFLSVAAVSALPTNRRLDDVVLGDKAALAEGDMTPGIPSLHDVVHAFNGATTKDTDAESIVSSVMQLFTAVVPAMASMITQLVELCK